MTKSEFSKTVLTVKVVIVKDQDEVLLLKRSKKSKNPGKWDLPGGHLDKGETLEEAIKREVTEETGLKIKVADIIGTTEFSKDSKHFKNEKRGLRYLAYFKEGEVKLNKKEHQEFEWLKIDEALNKLSRKDGFENEKREAILKAKENLELKNSLGGWQRAMADLENYKKRTAKENEDFKRYCLEEYVLGVLPVLDNFEFALQHVPEQEAENNWIVGILHIKKQLESFLTDNGVDEIESKEGDKFDENIHEVIEKTEETTEKNPKIKQVVKKGYKIGDKIIRPVMIKM